MAQTASRLPEEDRPQIRPDELRDRERAAGGGSTGSAGSSNPGKTGSRGKSGGNTGTSGSIGGQSGGGSTGSGLYNPSDPKSDEEDQVNGFYNASGGKGGRNRNKRSRFSKRNKIIGIGLAGIVSASVGISTIFFMGIFNLPNFVKNIEQAGFQRYQVDINGRSSKWLQAYMELRFGEIEDPNLAAKDRDNVFFRSDRVDTNKSLTDWYRTLRASKFEQDLFEQKGIRFTSIAERRGNSVVYRSGVISFKDTDKRITFDPGQKTFEAMERGDPNAFNGALQDFVQVDQKFETDKEARAQIKKIVNQNDPGWWKAIKRYHVRQDIQNMIGVRKWTFFENTRNKLNEKKISYRNKIITQALPDDSKTGDFVKCLFGVPDCKASTDPGNQNADDHGPVGSQKEGDKTDGNPDNPQPLGDGTGEATLEEGASVAKSGAGDVAGRIISKLIAKAGILSMLDSLARFDQALNDHKLSKIITQAKTQQAIGFFAVFSVAADQLTTGQQSGSEVNSFMQQFKHPTNNEGWTTVVDPQKNSGAVSAASTEYVQAKDKAAFCSDKHQAEMNAHPKLAEDEFQWQCPENTIGATSRGHELEDSWNSGPGALLHPILDVFHKATGGIFDVFNAVTSAITDPIISAALAATGQTANLENLIATVATKALEFGGASMGVTEDSPSGGVAMVALQGSAAQGEASMRDQGAASTNAESRTLANRNVMAYEAEQRHSNSFYTRYLSPSNPKSLFATEFFAITTNFDNTGRNFLGVFASAISAPLRVLTQPAHAAVPDGYAASKFAGIETFDFPPQCLNSQPLNQTPRSVTNADDLGIFKPDELTWDLVNNKDAWYKALYEKVGNDEDKAKTVWNCALFDNTVRGGMSARYGYPGENALPNNGGGAATVGASIVSGDAQQLAQEILANDKISKTGRYVMEDLQHTANGQPAYDDVSLDLKMLQFMAELGQTTPFTITSITGAGSGHSDGSNHYSGKAVDFGCGFDEAKADEVGKKYGYMADNERCDDGIDHSHFSEDGF
jgi:hypothetical protein